MIADIMKYVRGLGKSDDGGPLPPSLPPQQKLFASDLHLAILAAPNRLGRILVYTCGAAVVIALLWSILFRLDEVTVAQGRVIPFSREQVIQSLEPGTLAELLVREGDQVIKGQPLLKIDETRSDASYQEARERWFALLAQGARLQAEAYGKDLRFPPELEGRSELIERETLAFESRKRALEDAVAGFTQSLELAEREQNITEPLVKKGLVSELELIRLRRQINEIKTQMTERKNRYASDANTELSKIAAEAAQVSENIRGRIDTLSRMVIKAPVNGIVKNIRLTTIGGVVQSGQDLLEIVPLDDQLLVEAFVKPSDVALLRPGLGATVKITAYDYSTYGGLKGVVEIMSPDTVKDERAKGKGPNPVALEDSFYRLLIKTDRAYLVAKGETFPIIPGMTANVEIRTGDKSVAEYIFRPVKRIREAMRER